MTKGDLEIRIDRGWRKENYTVSRVFVDGVRFGDGKHYCNALEDKDRGLTSDMSVDEIVRRKVYGKTAIPAGRYKVTMSWSPRFRKMMPHVEAVKGFTGIRLHPLNTAEQSEGCIGFGANDRVGWISQSKYWTGMITDMIETTLKSGHEVWLQVG